MNTSHLLNDLNESQKKTVLTTEGPVLVVAGPGTGKTLSIVRRIAYLISQDIKPENILAVTFTNRAAREMRERTDALIGRNSGNIFIGTFHLLGLKIMKETLSDNFLIYNREDQINLLKELMKDSDLKKTVQGRGNSSYMKLADKISRIKNYMEDTDDEMKVVFEKYQSMLTRNSAFDFDDLILYPIELLSSKDRLEKYRNTFRYIIVDEYQDINPAQYKLLRLLVGNKGNICAVGDSDQAIYAFRGADVENFLNFGTDFEDAKMIHLTENHRSTGIILNASNIIIKNNQKRIDKDLSSIREKGNPVTVISAPDVKAEGEIIIKEIEERMGGTSHYKMIYTEKDYSEHAYRFSDFAVVFRTNTQAKAIEEAFITSGIPFQVLGAAHILKRKEIADTLSYLKAIINPFDDLSLMRVISISPMGISDADRSEISSYARENGLSLYESLKSIANQGDNGKRKFLSMMEKFMELKNSLPIDEFLKTLLEGSGLKEFYKDSGDTFLLLENLASAYRDIEPSEAIERFTNEISLLTPAEAYDTRADTVTIMTLHMAKGLEFRVVFIAGVEDGLIPYTMKKDSIDIEEERRLLYVGMTRAKDELFLIHSRNRFLYGKRLAPSPSPFLKEIPDEFIQSIVIPDRVKKQKEEDKQIGLF